MGKKGKCKNEKSKRKYDRFKESNQQILNGSSDSDEKTSSVEDLAKVANCCVKCMKPINERNHSHEPNMREVMDIFDDKTTIENFKRVLQYINELVDNYDITGKIDEMIQQGLEVILIQGMQFTNTTIQYYAIHALSVVVRYMNEKQLHNLMQCGLLDGFAAALQSDFFFIIQEAIEACSSLAVKSIEMRDIVAAFGSLHMCELLSMYYQIISKEFASVIAKFLCDLCHLEPVSEFILRRVANAARYLLRHEEYEIRLIALDAILKVASNKDLIIIFNDDYMENILKFLDSPRRCEIKAAFNIASEFTKQYSSNTDELIKSGFIEKIRQVLEKNATPDFGYDACSMLARILSNASYFDSVIRSGLVLLLLGLMDEGTDLYKSKACKALTCMHSNLSRKNAVRLAEEAYLEKICNILIKNNDNNCIACALALLNCILSGCLKERVEKQLMQTTKYVKESKAYEYIAEYIDSESFKIQNLAENLHHQLNYYVKDYAEEKAKLQFPKINNCISKLKLI